MIKYIIVISLVIGSVGFSQEIIHTETYENGFIDKITYHKKQVFRHEGKSIDVISPVKMEEYYKNGVLYKVETYSSFPEKYLLSRTKWYDEGQKKSVETYKDGEESGKWTQWYENGQKYVEGTFKNGKEEGVHTMWNKDGTMKKQKNWKDGKEISSKTF